MSINSVVCLVRVAQVSRPVLAAMWGRLLTCGRLSIGLPRARNWRSVRFSYAAPWGSQSWLQPDFQPAPLDRTYRTESTRKPAARRIARPTSSQIRDGLVIPGGPINNRPQVDNLPTVADKDAT